MSSCEPSSCEPRSPRGKTTHQHRRRCHHRFSEHLRAAISTRQGAAVSPPPELDSEGTETVPGLDIPELGSMGAHHHPSKKKQPPW